MWRRLRSVLAHPAIQFAVGMTMVVTGLAELIEAFDGAVVASSAHGVVLYGLIQAGKGALELVEGLEKVEGERSPG